MSDPKLQKFAEALESLQKEHGFKLVARLNVSANGISPIVAAEPMQEPAPKPPVTPEAK
jgi:hypothetical protein